MRTCYWLTALVAACTILFAGADRARAQYPYAYGPSRGLQQMAPPSPYGLAPRYSPSPYLGLLQRGNNNNNTTTGNLMLNYSNLVQPQIQTRDAIQQQQLQQQQLSGQTENLQRQLTQIGQENPLAPQARMNPRTGASLTLRPTGHQVTFGARTPSGGSGNSRNMISGSGYSASSSSSRVGGGNLPTPRAPTYNGPH